MDTNLLAISAPWNRSATRPRQLSIMRMILELVEAAMGHVVLISGPPGCGKTSWALQTLQDHVGPCAYLRLEADKEAGLEQGADSGIDKAWLKDQVPRLEEPTASNTAALKQENDALIRMDQKLYLACVID